MPSHPISPAQGGHAAHRAARRGDQRVRITDVAREAGVAISTVSAALNGRDGVSEQTRERIAGIAERLGWVPSMRGRSLVSRRAWTVGLLVQRPASVLEADPFFAGFIGGVETVLDDAGYALLLQVAATRERVLLRVPLWARSEVVDGIFLTDVQSDDPRFEVVDRLGLPAVAINCSSHHAVATVDQQHRPGLVRLLQHLLAQGHTRIAHVSGPPGFVHSAEREATWRSLLTGTGLAPGALFVGDFTSEGGVRAADRLLAVDNPPTAVVCANDLTAIGFISRASALGFSVPSDVSVTGFDGIQLSGFTTPALTTVQTSPHHLGVEAARLLLHLIASGEVLHREIRPAELRVRGSTAPPRP